MGQEQLHTSRSGHTHKSLLKFSGNGEGHWVQRGGLLLVEHDLLCFHGTKEPTLRVQRRDPGLFCFLPCNPLRL